MQLAKSPWQMGFDAGIAFIAELPYKTGTPEAVAWLQGWLEGAFRVLNVPHFEMQQEALPVPDSDEREKWKVILLDRFFPDISWS